MIETGGCGNSAFQGLQPLYAALSRHTPGVTQSASLMHSKRRQQQQPPPPQQQQPPQQATWQQEHLLAQRACRSCGSLPSEFEGMASQCSVGMHGADVSSGAPDQPSTLGIPDESLVLRSIPGTVAAA